MFDSRIKQANKRAKTFNAKGKITARTIKNLYIKQMGKCACCGLLLQGDFEIDHIIPLSKGGTNYFENLQLLRPICNKRKSSKYQTLCFRHLVKPDSNICNLCRAYTEANGDFERARKLFIKRKY